MKLDNKKPKKIKNLKVFGAMKKVAPSVLITAGIVGMCTLSGCKDPRVETYPIIGESNMEVKKIEKIPDDIKENINRFLNLDDIGEDIVFKYNKWEKVDNEYKRNVEVYAKESKKLLFTFVKSTDNVIELKINKDSYTEDYIYEDGFFINKDTSDYIIIEKKDDMRGIIVIQFLSLAISTTGLLFVIFSCNKKLKENKEKYLKEAIENLENLKKEKEEINRKTKKF